MFSFLVQNSKLMMSISKTFIRKTYLVTAVRPIADGGPLVTSERAEARPHLLRDHNVKSVGGRRFEVFVANQPLGLVVDGGRL